MTGEHASSQAGEHGELRDRIIEVFRRADFRTTDAQLADRVLAVRDVELDRLAARVAEYENAINWETSCLACSATLDSSIKEHERAERAEAAIERARTKVTLIRRGIRNRPAYPSGLPVDERDQGMESVCVAIDNALGQPPAEKEEDPNGQ